MKIKGIAWLGTRTSKYEQTLNLFQNVMGMKIKHQEPGFAVMDLPNGDLVEVFGDESDYNRFFTHPVAGFLVDDIESARAEMEVQGIEFIGPIERSEDGNAWTHFRAPDGFIYELTYSPERPQQ
ncbi:MAG TPA: VOC family protein [Anaerolineales bacterium]|nr:VOC family protein [Anaerolineales bacterium]